MTLVSVSFLYKLNKSIKARFFFNRSGTPKKFYFIFVLTREKFTLLQVITTIL